MIYILSPSYVHDKKDIFINKTLFIVLYMMNKIILPIMAKLGNTAHITAFAYGKKNYTLSFLKNKKYQYCYINKKDFKKIFGKEAELNQSVSLYKLAKVAPVFPYNKAKKNLNNKIHNRNLIDYKDIKAIIPGISMEKTIQYLNYLEKIEFLKRDPKQQCLLNKIYSLFKRVPNTKQRYIFNEKFMYI